jgi:hypothetical protein
LECGCDVVEAFGSIVLREKFVSIDLNVKKVPNRVCIFLAIQAVQYDLIRDVRLAFGVVERRLEPRNERVACRAIRLLRTRRRHDAAAQLPHGFLEQVGMLADARRRNALETDTAGFCAIIVAPDTVLLDGGQLSIRC